MTAPPVEQADPLAAALERRRRARFTAPAPEVELHTALERLRQQRLERGMVGAEAEAATARPMAADVLPARPVPPSAGPETVPYSPLPGLRMQLAVPSVPRTVRGVSEPEARQTAGATEQAARDVAAGKARVLLPGGVPASFTERAVGRALARLPGAVGDYGASLTSLGERHQQLEELGAAETSWLARLPADLGNVALELEAGGRIPGTVGRTIGAGYAQPVLGSLVTGELAAPGLEATLGRVGRLAGREAARFGTLETVKGIAEQAPPGEIAVRGLAGAEAGGVWGLGAQVAREAIARAVGAALKPTWEGPRPPPAGLPPGPPPEVTIRPEPPAPAAPASPEPRVARAPGVVETFAPGEPQRVEGPTPAQEGQPAAPAAEAPGFQAPPAPHMVTPEGKFVGGRQRRQVAKIPPSAPPVAPASLSETTVEQLRGRAATFEELRGRVAAAQAAEAKRQGLEFAALRRDETIGEPEKKYAGSARDYHERIIAALASGRVQDARALYAEVGEGHPTIGSLEARIAAQEAEAARQQELLPAAPPGAPPPRAEVPGSARGPTVQRTVEEAGKPASPEDLTQLVDAAHRDITAGTLPRDARGVRAWAERTLGRPYTSGTWTTDDVFDAIEVAANRMWQAQVGPMRWQSAQDIISRLRSAREVEEKILGTRTRTEAMVARQQFSTPIPIAEAAAYAADVLPGEKVLEPSAGTGNLINSLRGTGAVLHANELDPRRATLLRLLDTRLEVTSEDALRLQLGPRRYNAIVMNPPFGGYNIKGKYGGQGALEFQASDISQRFVAAALKSLAPDGRLVAIMPEGMMGSSASGFRTWLRYNYHVVAMIEAPPGSYATRGTTFGSWLLVVDNSGPRSKQDLPEPIRQPTWEAWQTAVAQLGRPERLMRPGGHEPAVDVARRAPETPVEQPPVRPAAAPAPTAPPVAQPVQPSPVAEAAQAMAEAVKQAVKDAVEEVRRAQPAAPVEAAAPPGPGVPRVGAGTPPESAGGVGVQRGPEPGRPTPGRGGGAAPPAAGGAGVVAPEAPGEPRAAVAGAAPGVVLGLARRRVEPGRLDSPERRAELQAANDSPVFTPYERGTTVERNPHPRLVVETRSQAGMPPPPLSATEFQSAVVQRAWGRSGKQGGISDDQADMALRVLSAWDRGHGFLVADDVGVGKTREAAVLILEAIARGQQRIIYSSFNAVNLTDVQKELRLVATGSEEGEFPATFVLGADYPTAMARPKKPRTEGLPQVTGPTIYLVHAYNFAPLAESLIELNPQVWVGDEAHQFKSAFADKGIAWQKVHAHMLETGGQFAYFTATPAVTLDQMGYLYGLKEWRPGGFNDWLRRRLGKEEEGVEGEGEEAVAAQGAANVEVGERPGIAAAEPTGKKPFMREQIDAFSGRITPAETEQVMRELKGLGKFLARSLWRGGVSFDVEPVDLLGDSPEATAARARFDQAAELSRDIILATRKFGMMNKQVKQSGAGVALTQSYLKQVLFDLRMPAILRRADASLAAGRQVVISVHSVTGDVDPDEGVSEETADIPLNKRMEAAINAINTREVRKVGSGENVEYEDLGEINEALAKRAELLDRLRGLPPLSDPVRRLEDHFGSTNLAVITGQVAAPNRVKQMGEFQSGARKVALISRAGKTGISLHDVNGFVRHLIVGDYEWSADTFWQELGRVDRAGQLSKPLITLIASNLAAELKFAATIAARMAGIGASSRGSAEATGTDALDQFEVSGDVPVAAMKNAIEKLPDDLRQYFTGRNFVEAKQGYRGETVWVPKRRPDGASLKQFLLELLKFPVHAAERVLKAWIQEREALLTGEAVEALAARRTGRLQGRVLRTTALTGAPHPVQMSEVQNDAGEHRAILQGFVTQHITQIQTARGRDERGFQRPRRYVAFTDHTSGELVAGLDVAPAEARRIKTAFGAGGTRHITPAEAFSDLQAGDNLAIDGPEGEAWTLHPRRDGRVQIQGATLAKHRDVLRGYAQYEPVGNFLYVKGGDTAEGIAKFLERFPVKQAVGAAAPPVPPEPTAARYERLGRILRAPLPLRTRELLQDRLIEAGHDRAEVEALDDRGLANRVLESQVLTPEEESKLLDGMLGEAGVLRISKRGRARMAGPPEVPPPGIGDAFAKMVNPSGRGPGATEAAGIIRARFGELARQNEQALVTIGDVRAGFPKLNTAEGLELADRMEAGQPVDPQWQTAAAVIRRELDAARTRVQDLGIGKLEHFIADYLPHLWEKPEQAVGIIQRIMGRRPLQGPKTFLKHRTIPTIAEGVEAGLVPATVDLLDMVVLKLREMNRYVMGQRIMQDLRKNGLVKFVRAGKAPPAGYRRIDDPIARVYGPFTEEGAMTIRGEFYAPEPVATLLNNHLGPGLRGNPLFDAYSFVGNTLNGIQLGLSAFHLGFVSVDAIVSQMALGLEQLAAGRVPRGLANIATQWQAPFTTLLEGNRVIREYQRPGSSGGDFAAIADAVTKGGGRISMDRFYKNSSIERMIDAARKGRMGTATFHVLPAAVEFAAKPIMEWFVPRMKLGVFAQLARFELSRLPPDATVEQVQQIMAKAWDSVDNRMGQLVYDNLFWNRTLKDLSMASVRALGWNLGSAREIGGGVYDLGRGRFTHRGAYVIALPIAVGLMGAVLMYLLTGHGPESVQDYYEPRTGKKDADGNDERVSLPSYMKDVIAFRRHSVQTIGHKLHPFLAYIADMLQNKDYWGDQIRNAHDPLVQQLKQVALYTLSQFTPIGIRNIAEQEHRLQTGPRALLPLIGITPARREAVRSPAQNLMQEYLQERGVGGATPEQQAERQVRSDLIDRYRRGDLTYGQVREQLHAEGFTADQIATALRQLREPPLLGRFKQLTLEEAEAVYKKGTERERELWGPTLFRKRAEAHPRHPPRPARPQVPHH